MNTPFSNDLTPAQAERLAILAEECGEVVQAIGKILRHGYESCHPCDTAGPNNAEYLLKEVFDLRAAILMISLDLPPVQTDAEVDLKTLAALRKKLFWAHHQGDDFKEFTDAIQGV